MLKFGGLALAAAVLVAAAPATAATTINLFSGGTTAAGGRAWTSGGVNLRVTAWALSGTTPIAATLGQFSEGLGVSYGSNDEHTVDNNGANGEFLLFQFDRAVTLGNAAFSTGWFNMNDTDASISHANVNYAASGLSYTDSSAAFWNAAGSQLTANIFGSGSTGASGNNARNINPAGISSNTWLIAASLNNPDAFRDSFKLKTVSFVATAPVPEPGTWALMILGMGSVGGAMRRRVKNRARVRTSLAFA